MVRSLIKEWGYKKQRITIKKNKTFYESKLLSLNINKAKKELQWEPRLSLDETIKFTVDWYKFYFLNMSTEDISTSQIEYYINK